MPPSELGFVTPTSVSDALGELAEGGALPVAGGTSIAMLLKNDLLDVERLVSLRRIPELSGIERLSGGEVRIGATVNLREDTRSEVVRQHLPSLSQAAGHVGNPRVRAVATLGGALVHGDPRQDVPPALLSLGARVRIAGPAGEREVLLSESFLDFMTTVVGEDELVLDVVIPVDDAQRATYTRFTPASAEDYPVVAVASAVSLDAGGTVTVARIGLGGATSTAMLAGAAELLVGTVPDRELVAEVAASAADAANPSTDQRGSADFKRAMIKVWTHRNLTATLPLH